MYYYYCYDDTYKQNTDIRKWKLYQYLKWKILQNLSKNSINIRILYITTLLYYYLYCMLHLYNSKIYYWNIIGARYINTSFMAILFSNILLVMLIDVKNHIWRNSLIFSQMTFVMKSSVTYLCLP